MVQEPVNKVIVALYGYKHPPADLNLCLSIREVRKLLASALCWLERMRQPILSWEDVFGELSCCGELCAVVHVVGRGAYVGGLEEVEDVCRRSVSGNSPEEHARTYVEEVSQRPCDSIWAPWQVGRKRVVRA